MALYRTYRPKTLDDLVGQEHITDILRAQAKSGTYSQNYLLCGTRGAGKTSTARLIAKLVNAQVFDNN
jgi:DNA polymerase III subunit gamma/tau